MTERFKPIKPLPEDSIKKKSQEEKMYDSAKKTPKDAMKRVGKFKGGMLKGGQKKLDANKDGKISGEDFAMLRNVRMQKKDAMGKKVVKAESGQMITEAEAPVLGGVMGAGAALSSPDILTEVDIANAERIARRRPLSVLGPEKEKPMTPKQRREKDIAKRAQKKMGGGMMQDSMGYKKGGAVRGGRAEMKGLRPAKLF